MPSAPSSQPALSATSNHTAVAGGVHDEQVRAFAGELRPAVVQDVAGGVAGLGREPEDHLARLGALRELDEDVRVRVRTGGSGSVDLLDLVGRERRGRKSATAAAIATASAPFAAASMASRSSGSCHVDDLHAGGIAGSAVCPATSVTAAPPGPPPASA